LPTVTARERTAEGLPGDRAVTAPEEARAPTLPRATRQPDTPAGLLATAGVGAPTAINAPRAETSTAARARGVADRIVHAAEAGQQALRIEVRWEERGVHCVHVDLAGSAARVRLDCASSDAALRARELEAPIRARLEACGLQLSDFTTSQDGRSAAQRQEAQPAFAPASRDWRALSPAPKAAGSATRSTAPAVSRLDILV
jgi:hypothetical protein